MWTVHSNKYNKKEILFFCGIFLWIIQEYIVHSNYLNYFGYVPSKYMRIFALFLFIYKIILCDKYTKKQFILIVICAVIAITGAITGNEETDNTLTRVLIIILSSKNIDFNKICKFIAYISGAILLFIILSDKFGVIESTYIEEYNRKRYGLGFDYVTFPAIYFVNIVCCAFYFLHCKKNAGVSWKIIILVMIINDWIFVKTGTRLAFGIVSIFLIFYIMYAKLKLLMKKYNRIVEIMITLIFPIASFLIYLVSRLYDSNSSGWINLNRLSNNRIVLNHKALDIYGISLLGQQIQTNTNMSNGSYFYIDSGYMNMLLRYGVLSLTLLLIIYSLLIRQMYKNKNIVLTIWLICICIYNIFNGMLFSPIMNSSILAFWMIGNQSNHDK